MKIIHKAFENVYSIQESGLIAVPSIGEGRMIPAVVLNSDKDSKLEELLKVHRNSSGDVIVQWVMPLAQILKPKKWYLRIEFSQPMEFIFQIKFDIKKNYSIIDAIHQSRALHLRYGMAGEKISQKQDDMILVEIPNTNTDKKWNHILTDIVKDNLRKAKIPKKQLSVEVYKHISNMREILSYRKTI